MAGAPSSSPSLLLAGEQRNRSPMDGAQKIPAGSPLPPPLFLPQASRPFPLLSKARRASLAPASSTPWPDLPPLWASLAVPCAQLSLSSTPHFLPWKNQQRAPFLTVRRGARRLFVKMCSKPRAAAALQFILHFLVASHRSRVCCAANSTSRCPPGVCCFCAAPSSSSFTPVRPRRSMFDSASTLFSYD
jgi:hypothetical protein